MRFLIDANMPRSTAELLKRYGHEATDVRDIGMGGAADSEIATYAQGNRLALVTRDFDFADVRNYPPAQYAGILVLELPEDAVATFVLRVLESFVANNELVQALPGRLAIVQPTRVRLRPPISVE
jgi:predicted nuclease of predicted toxin-antitoxin system